MQAHNFICDWLHFVLLAENLKDSFVEVISSEKVSGHAVSFKRGTDVLGQNVANDALF